MNTTESQRVAIEERFINALNSLQIRFIGKVISERTGYKSGTISEYLNRKTRISDDFMKIVCEKFSIDYDEIIGGRPESTLNNKQQTIKNELNGKAKSYADAKVGEEYEYEAPIDEDMYKTWLKNQKKSTYTTFYDDLAMRHMSNMAASVLLGKGDMELAEMNEFIVDTAMKQVEIYLRKRFINN